VAAHALGSAQDSGWVGLAAGLARAATPGDVLDVVADSAAELLGAHLVNISLLEGDGRWLALVTSRHTTDAVEQEFARYPADAPLPSTDALLSGTPVLLRSVRERDQRYPALVDVAVDHTAFAVLPLRWAGANLGVLGLGWVDPQTFPAEHVERMGVVADLCAAAVDRAQAYARERHTRALAERSAARLAVLNRLIAGLAAVTGVGGAARAVLHLAVPAVGADAGAVSEQRDTDELVVLATAGMAADAGPGAGRVAVSDSPIAADVLRTGAPVFASSRQERDARYPVLAARGVRQGTWVGLPLLLQGAQLGVMALGWDADRDFDTEEREFLSALAVHVALAIERGRAMEASRGIAETLQRALLPPPPPLVPGWRLGACYIPAVEGTRVGGDWYDIFPVGGGRVALVVGDVMGKGVAAAAVMGSLRAAIRAFASQDPEPGHVLDAVDGYLAAFGGQELATCCYVLLDPATGVVQYSNAGHPPPLVLDRTGAPRWLTDALAPLLGVLPPRGRPTAVARVDTTLVLYSDGLVEDRHVPISDGMDALATAVGSADLAAGPGPAAQALAATLTAGHTNTDDVALLLATRDAPGLSRRQRE